MTINPTDALPPEFAASLHKHWVLFVVEGVVLMLLGAVAIILPPIATLATALILGWLFLISGVVGLFTTFWMRGAPGFLWSLVSALLGIIAGAILIGWPLNGIFSLTLVLIVFFMIEGFATIFYALDHRRALSGRWGWMLVSGIVDLILAGVIFSGLPASAAWAVGLLVGINMVFGGSGLIAMGLRARMTDSH